MNQILQSGIVEDFPSFGSVKREYRDINVDLVHPGAYQPRISANDPELQELSASLITTEGNLQPIVVRPRAGGGFEILAGERRWRATMMAGLSTITACIGSYSNYQARLIGVIENTQRKDINAWEEARAVESIMEETELTHEQVAIKVGKSRSHVSNLLRLLQADAVLQGHVRDSLIDMSAAKLIMGVDDHLEQARLARITAARKWSVRQLDAHIRANYVVKTKARKDADVTRLASNLTNAVGHECQIGTSPTGRGTLTFSFSSNDDLQNLLHNLGRAHTAIEDDDE